MFENFFKHGYGQEMEDKRQHKGYIPLFFHCKNMKLVNDGSRVTKPNARLALNKNA